MSKVIFDFCRLIKEVKVSHNISLLGPSLKARDSFWNPSKSGVVKVNFVVPFKVIITKLLLDSLSGTRRDIFCLPIGAGCC